MKIRSKLILTILALSLIPLAISNCLFYFHAKKELTDDVLNHLESVASIQQARIQGIYDQNLERLRLVASRTQLRISLDKFNADNNTIYQDKMNRILTDAKNSIPDFKIINIYTLDGTIAASTDKKVIGRNELNRKAFKTGLIQNQANIFAYDDTQVLKVHLSGPLYLKEKLIGVLVIESTTKNILSSVSDFTGLGHSGETILATQNNQKDAVFLMPLRFDKNAALTLTISKDQKNIPITHALNGEEKVFNDYVDYRGVQILSVSRYIDAAGWGLVVKIDKKEAFSQLNRMFMTLFLLITISSFLIIIISILWARKITSPIAHLTHTAAQIIDGNIRVKANESSSDEIGVLGRTFNIMTSSLIQIKNDLEDKVKELQKVNDALTKENTLRLNTELILREREENLAITLNSIGDAVVTTDIQGNVTHLNPVAEQLTGWANATAQGKSVKTVFPIVNASTREPIENPIEKIMTTGEIVYLSNHTTLIAKDGSEYQIADSAAPIRNDKDHITGMVLVFNDVTEKYQLRQAINKQLERFKELSNLALTLTGEPQDIFNNVSELIGRLLDVKVVCLSEVRGDELFFLSVYVDGQVHSNMGRCDISITPCSTVEHDKDIRIYHRVAELFPKAAFLKDHNAFSYCGFPALDSNGKVLAVTCLLDDKPHEFTEEDQDLLRIFGQRIGLELERVANLNKLKMQEEQLRHTQKMDALGKLTGGIAHDYNNMLGVILGYASLLEDALSAQPKLLKYTQQVRHAGERGAKLTQKLLAFSQKKHSDAKPLDLNLFLQNEKQILEKTLTARIQLVFNLSEEIGFIWVDSGDMEDALLNMSINAMHAIKAHGTLTIETHNEQISILDAKLFNLSAGDYVTLSISDTGCGMDNDTKEKIFEPFFSTKGEKGTGLGLSQVYGFVERSGGKITVYSEPEHGTRFVIYFPRHHKSNSESSIDKSNKNTIELRGNETILIVDDEQALLDLTSEILNQQGYQVICAKNGQQALAMLKHQSIDVLLSDVIMPDMDGYQLAAIVQKKHPSVKIQLASGFTGESHQYMVDETLRHNLLHKPYHAQVLFKKIRELLDKS